MNHGHFQRDHQQNLARAQQRLARKQTAAALQRVQQFCGAALYLHIHRRLAISAITWALKCVRRGSAYKSAL